MGKFSTDIETTKPFPGPIDTDVAFLSQDDVENAWCGILFELADGISEADTALHQTPAPFWYVFTKSQPAEKFGTISTLFDVPVGSKNLYLQIQAMPQMAKNDAAEDNIRIEIVGE